MRRLFSSATLADFIYRWRLPATAVIILGAILSVPRADITHIDNDITAWFSKEDPVYKDYERFRNEFGGTRSLIVALKADSSDRLFSRETLKFIQQVSGDIARIDTVNRVDSLASATIVRALPGRLKPASTETAQDHRVGAGFSRPRKKITTAASMCGRCSRTPTRSVLKMFAILPCATIC